MENDLKGRQNELPLWTTATPVASRGTAGRFKDQQHPKCSLMSWEGLVLLTVSWPAERPAPERLSGGSAVLELLWWVEALPHSGGWRPSPTPLLSVTQWTGLTLQRGVGGTPRAKGLMSLMWISGCTQRRRFALPAPVQTHWFSTFALKCALINIAAQKRSLVFVGAYFSPAGFYSHIWDRSVWHRSSIREARSLNETFCLWARLSPDISATVCFHRTKNQVRAGPGPSGSERVRAGPGPSGTRSEQILVDPSEGSSGCMLTACSSDGMNPCDQRSESCEATILRVREQVAEVHSRAQKQQNLETNTFKEGYELRLLVILTYFPYLWSFILLCCVSQFFWKLSRQLQAEKQTAETEIFPSVKRTLALNSLDEN